MTTTYTNQTKHTSSYSNQTKNTSVFSNTQIKVGSPWRYNQAGFTYNQVVSPVSGKPIYYNAEGTVIAWTNQVKN